MTEAHAGGAARVEHLLELGRSDAAGELAARLVANDPGNPHALCLLAQAQLGIGRPAAALSAAEQAAVADPENEWPLRLCAIAQNQLGHVNQARTSARRAVAADPNSWQVHFTQAQIALQHGAHEAEPAAREALRLDPLNADCHELLGDVLLDRGDTAAAQAAYREALALDPRHAGAHHGLALVHARRRNLGRAAAAFADAAAADPADGQAVRNLVTVAETGLSVVHLVLWGVLFVTVRVAHGTGRHPAAVGGFAVAAVLLAGLIGFLWWGARPRTWWLTRLALRRDRLLALWAASLAVTFGCFGLAAVLPAAQDGLLGTTFVALLVGVVASWVRSVRKKRAARRDG